ncbi:SAM-dependent methyltransferase [Gemmatimonadota bacterium]
MWDQRYSADEFAYGKEPNDFLVELLPVLPRGKALCLGAGEGRNAVFLAQNGYEVTAVDLSAVGLKKAESLARERSVAIRCVVADLKDYTIEPDAWDLILSIFCHTPAKIRRRIHSGVVTGLSPGGAFVLEAFTVDQMPFKTGGPSEFGQMMSSKKLLTDLKGLQLTLNREVVREIHEGRYHNGQCAVVQLLATNGI